MMARRAPKLLILKDISEETSPINLQQKRTIAPKLVIKSLSPVENGYKKRITTSPFNNKGDQVEIFVAELLKASKLLQNVRRSQYNCRLDILYEVDGQTRGIQVKKLSKGKMGKYGFNYRSAKMNGYAHDTVIICIHTEDKKAVLLTGGDVKDTKAIKVSKLGNPGQWNRFLLPSWDNLFRELEEAALTSTIYDESRHLTSESTKEKESIERFVSLCKQFSLEFIPSESNADMSDGIINGKKIQLKFRSTQATNRRYYQTNMLRSHGRTVADRTPYEKGNNDFYIFEVGGPKDNPKRYFNNFLIIPEDKLIEEGIIKTEHQKGKTFIQIYPFDYLTYQKKAIQAAELKGNWTIDRELWYNSSSKSLPF
jgi:hypothetical protein